MNYYTHHIGDYMKKTRGRTLVERGAYRELMDLYYATEQPLTADVSELCRSIGAQSRVERTAVELILKTYFVLSADGYTNRRCDEEIEKHQDFLEKQARNGKKGGRPRKANYNPSHNPNESGGFNLGSQNENPNESPHSPLPNTHSLNRDKESALVSDGQSEYDHLLALWESIRERDPASDPANLVSSFEKGHLTNLYFGHGFEKVRAAIDELGQHGWYVTPKQLREYLTTSQMPTQGAHRAKRQSSPVANLSDPKYYEGEGI
jgi:uncharacterized protein YdaU (DUF1376 family)